ncbi:hypothetical protein JW859_03820 [bacterium]|nr:hypothetical protein [bacterium]
MLILCGCPQAEQTRASGGDSTSTDTAATTAGAWRDTPVSVLFIHHSCGSNLISQGDIRNEIGKFNQEHGTRIGFWDHGYNKQGLRDAQGKEAGCYDIPGDNTNPDGLHALWTSGDETCVRCREQILKDHEVIAFKSCYPANAINSDAKLEQYKKWYLEMRDFFGTQPQHKFVVVTSPPLHHLATTADDARRARAFANWLSGEYLAGQANVFCFDLYNELAEADQPSDTANMLLRDFEKDANESDSHPNNLANSLAGPKFARFLCEIAAQETNK